jgi:alginate O-acetyltransferase complex protein AlgI
MLFHSPNFLIFMLLLLIPFYLWRRGRIPMLVVANIIFYAANGVGVLLLFMAVTLITYIVVHLMQRDGWRWVFWIGIAVTAGNMIFYKYTLMLLYTVESLSGQSLLLTSTVRDWLTTDQGTAFMVVGISFYTFQLISYLIDVRRGKTQPTTSFTRFWVYIALFPQLIAGPIMRGDELIPQLDELHRKDIRWQEIRFGLYLVFVGLMKKVIIADNLEVIVNPLFADAAALSPEQAWIAAYTFGFQIYFDFSAYSDMALGLGYMLGIRLIINFKTPYLSGNPSEFWTRWHISLSRWIRDYIYIGLGGNRQGASRTQINLLIAMVISGLWHGAMWHFVAWGAVHGLLLIIYKWTLELNRIEWIRALRQHWLYRIAAIAVFFHIVTWTWVFFRAENMAEALELSRLMWHVDAGALVTHSLMPLVVGLYALHIIEYVIREYESRSGRIWHWLPAPLRGVVYSALLLIVFYNMKGETYDFIYFQF